MDIQSCCSAQYLTLTPGLPVCIVAPVTLARAGEGGLRGAGEDGVVSPGHPRHTLLQGAAQDTRHHQSHTQYTWNVMQHVM